MTNLNKKAKTKWILVVVGKCRHRENGLLQYLTTYLCRSQLLLLEGTRFKTLHLLSFLIMYIRSWCWNKNNSKTVGQRNYMWMGANCKNFRCRVRPCNISDTRRTGMDSSLVLFQNLPLWLCSWRCLRVAFKLKNLLDSLRSLTTSNEINIQRVSLYLIKTRL